MMNHVNDRLVPKILDDGTIEGTYLMSNKNISEKETAVLTEGAIDRILKKDKKGVFKDIRMVEWLKQKKGDRLIIYMVDDWYDTYHIKFEDGQKITLKGLDSNPFNEFETQQERYSL